MLRRITWVPPAAASLGTVLLGAWILRDTFWGDPTIYLVYARNAAAGHPFQFNVGEFSSGVASPLWSLVLAVPFIVGAGVVGAKVWAASWAVAGLGSTLWVAGRLSGSLLAAAIASLFLAAWLSFYGVMTYDTGMTVAVVALSILACQRVEAGGSAIPLGLTWALLPLARADAGTIVAFELVALIFFANQAARRMISLAAVALIPAGAYYGYSQFALGSYTVSNATRTIDQLEAAAHFGAVAYSPAALQYLATIAPVLLVAAIGGWRSPRWLGLLASSATSAYVLLLVFYPVTIYVERYFLSAAPWVVVLVARALAHAPRFHVPLRAGTALVLVLGLAGPLLTAVTESERGNTFAQVTEAEVAALVNVDAPYGAVVLGYEVQARFGLREDLRWLSVNGLTDGRIHEWRERGDVAGFLWRYRPTLWIVNDSRFGHAYLDGTPLAAAREALRVSDATTVAGIRFRVVARPAALADPGFAGWIMLVRLDYGP